MSKKRIPGIPDAAVGLCESTAAFTPGVASVATELNEMEEWSGFQKRAIVSRG